MNARKSVSLDVNHSSDVVWLPQPPDDDIGASEHNQLKGTRVVLVAATETWRVSRLGIDWL